MNTIKKIVRSFPLLFNTLIFFKYVYNRFLINQLLKDFYTDKNISINSISTSLNSNTFFGYYNISPFNTKGEILFGQIKTNNIRGSLIEKLSIRLKSGNGIIKEINSSNAWNWQQGCMLQWFGNSDESIIYNDYSTKDDLYIAKIQNIVTNEEQVLNKPIYSVAKSGKFALTLNFDRLALMRPDYGYFNRNIDWDDLPSDSEDGIWNLDIEKNNSSLIITLEQLKNFHPVSTMEGARHKVNHIDISPDGKRFMFLHRWIGPQGRFMRLFTANCNNGGDLFHVTGNEMVSHNCWLGNNGIISFCKLPDGRNRYAHFKDKTGLIGIIGENDFSRDGHPSVSADGRWMLTDDYPDTSRFSGLYLYDLKNNKRYILGKFFQPLKFKKEKRIDLHPKWSTDGKHISIDSGHNGKRNMYILNIEKIINA
jgi:hypothetical protein